MLPAFLSKPNLLKCRNFCINQSFAAAGGASSLLFVILCTKLIKNHREALRFGARGFIHTVYAALCVLGLGGTNVVYDPAVLGLDRLMIVSNHVSVYDWLIIWLVAERLGFQNIIFCTKRLGGLFKPLNIAIKSLGFPVIEQQLDEDYVTLTVGAAKLNTWDKYCMVIFPEGKLRNSVVARNVGKTEPIPEILPIKTRGFCVLMNSLRESIQAIVDCTLVYDDTERLVMPGPSKIMLRRVNHPTEFTLTTETKETVVLKFDEMHRHSFRHKMKNLDGAMLAEIDREMDIWIRKLFSEKISIVHELKENKKTQMFNYPRQIVFTTFLVRLLHGSLKKKWLHAGIIFVAFRKLVPMARISKSIPSKAV